jgi:hypothetical protein
MRGSPSRCLWLLAADRVRVPSHFARDLRDVQTIGKQVMQLPAARARPPARAAARSTVASSR